MINKQICTNLRGSQFTIIEEILEEKLHIQVKKPDLINKEVLLETVNFDSSWYTVVK